MCQRLSSNSQCLLVKLGLLGPERGTTDAADTAVEVLVGEARPLGIAEHSTKTESAVAVSSGEAGPSWPRVKSTPSAVDTAVAMLAGEARPYGIEKLECHDESLNSRRVPVKLVARSIQPLLQQSQMLMKLDLQRLRGTAPRQNPH